MNSIEKAIDKHMRIWTKRAIILECRREAEQLDYFTVNRIIFEKIGALRMSKRNSKREWASLAIYLGMAMKPSKHQTGGEVLIDLEKCL